MKQILRHIAANKLEVRERSPESDSLQNYLNNSICLLARKSRYGLPQSEILNAAQNADDFVTEGERANLLSAMENIRRNFYYNVRRFTERERQGVTVFYNISANGPVNARMRVVTLPSSISSCVHPHR